MNASLRRGWCPGALKPMETGDGWLVRIHPPFGALTPDLLRSIAALAAQHGNGLADITARGNLQLRGIRPESHGPLVEALLDAGLVDSDEDDGPHRLVLTSPLAGRDPAERADALALAAAVAEACRGQPLPAKTCIAVDGGGLPLTVGGMDLVVQAVAANAWLIGLPDGRWVGPVREPAAMASRLLGLLSTNGERPARAGAALVAQALATLDLRPHAVPPPRPAPPRTGLIAEKGGTVAACAVAPFGRIDAVTMDALALLAARQGAHDIRLTPFRGVALTGLADGAAMLAALGTLGLIVDPADPRLSVAACPGAPACARGEAPAQADAGRFARLGAARLAAGLTLHVSGCAKGCAHPRAAGLTLVGRAGGYDIVRNGTAGAPPIGRLARVSDFSAFLDTYPA